MGTHISMQLTSISPKQTEILLLLYRYRFLNPIHIQKFLGHKSHTLITSWLKDLTDRQIIQKIDVKRTGEITNKPAIYYLGLKSRLLLRENDKCNPELLNRVYQEKKRSETFRNHWLAMADLYFDFLQASSIQKTALHFYTATDVADFAYAPLPAPDAYMVIEDKKQTSRYFLELIDGSEKWFAVNRRIKQYISYFKKNYWQEHVQLPFPSILLICPNTKLKGHLLSFIAKEIEKEEVDLNFFLSIHADIQQRGIQMDTWEGV